MSLLTILLGGQHSPALGGHARPRRDREVPDRSGCRPNDNEQTTEITNRFVPAVLESRVQIHTAGARKLRRCHHMNVES